MTYNFGLFFSSFYKSFFKAKGTHARLTRKRVSFILLFYFVWPMWSMVVWFSFLLDDILFPGFKRQKLDKPLFIIGNYRSGSTFLERVIARDTHNFASATIWDLYISPSVSLTKFFSLLRSIDRMIGNPLTRLMKTIDHKTLGRVRIHPISFFKPEEDENFLMHIWSSAFLSVLFPFFEDYEKYYYFDERVSDREKKNVMRFYRRSVQRHLFARRTIPHYLSKNPSFSPKITSILEEIPEARVVYLVRNPMDMLLSSISWLGFAWHVFGDPLVKYPFIEEIIQFSKYWYEHPLGVLSQADPARYLIVKYDDLVVDPEKTVREIYKKFGYELSRDFDKMLAEETEKSRRFRSPHAYSIEEIGLSRERVLEEFGEIYKRFMFELPGENSTTDEH